jgi:hypothetical protein
MRRVVGIHDIPSELLYLLPAWQNICARLFLV